MSYWDLAMHAKIGAASHAELLSLKDALNLAIQLHPSHRSNLERRLRMVERKLAESATASKRQEERCRRITV